MPSVTIYGVDANGNPVPISPVKTIEKTQATPPAPQSNPVSNPQSSPQSSPQSNLQPNAKTQPGRGAGSGQRGGDNNPGPNTTTTQQALAVFSTAANQRIVTQPNQLDQYASYTYGISWYVLTPQQYNEIINTQRANLAGWQLLMQSAGAPVKGRSPAFPDDYYMDDLEIDSEVMGGVNMPNSATRIKFRVVEPNGVTLVENLFRAVQATYARAQQPTNTKTTNYLNAQYCLVIQFYGYDKDGNILAPIKGSYSTTSGSAAGVGNQQAVITKYYPFTVATIDFRMANRAVEYEITGVPVAQWTASSTDRGTVPHTFVMTGQTVEQLLNGSPAKTNTNTTDSGERKTTTSPQPQIPPSAAPANEYAVNDKGEGIY
jgi:hypothetical protein